MAESGKHLPAILDGTYFTVNKRFLGEPCSSNIDSLNGFPAVKLLFRKLNATLPSSAAVERLFSKGSMISLPRRNRLNDKHFEELLLLKANDNK